MAKLCPMTNELVLYLDCLECEEKICQGRPKNQEEATKDNLVNTRKEEESKCFTML